MYRVPGLGFIGFRGLGLVGLPSVIVYRRPTHCRAFKILIIGRSVQGLFDSGCVLNCLEILHAGVHSLVLPIILKLNCFTVYVGARPPI